MKSPSSERAISGIVQCPSQLKEGTSLTWLALRYFIWSLLFLIFAFFLVETWAIPMLEDQWKLPSAAWDNEEKKLYRFMEGRNLADLNCPVWHSKGWPVDVDRRRAKRILVIGDSFVWGTGYANFNDLWWRQLERELFSRGFCDVEVIAAGIKGMNTRDELDVARKIVPKFKPDAVIFGYVLNDADEKSGSAKWDSPALASRYKIKLSKSIDSILNNTFPNLYYQARGMRKAAVCKDVTGITPSEFASARNIRRVTGESFEQYKRTVEELASYLHNLSVPYFIIALPHGCSGGVSIDSGRVEVDRGYYERCLRPVQNLFSANQIRFVNTLDHLTRFARSEKKLQERGWLWFGINPVDAHPNVWLTHFYAKEAADVLEANYPQCLGTRRKIGSTGFKLSFNDWIPPDLNAKQLTDGTAITYPEDEKSLPEMPIRKQHVELCLEMPAAISQIKLSGAGLKEAVIYVSCEEPNRHFDDGDIYRLGLLRGSELVWELRNKSWACAINTIRISAKFRSKDRQLLLKLVSPKGNETMCDVMPSGAMSGLYTLYPSSARRLVY